MSSLEQTLAPGSDAASQVACERVSWWRRVRRLAVDHQRAGWSVLDQAWVSATNFLCFLLLARFMEPAQFGVFVLGYTGLLLLSNLQNALFCQPHTVLAAHRPDDAFARFTAQTLVLQALVCALLALALIGVGVVLDALGLRTASVQLLVLAWVAPAWIGQESVRRVRYARSDSFGAAVIGWICYGLQLAGVLLLWGFAGEGALTAATALSVFGASSLIALCFGAARLSRHGWIDCHDLSWRDTLATGREVWGYGRWLSGQALVTWFGANGNAWLVAVMLGAPAVGLYRAAIHLVNVINPLRQAAFTYLPARASRTFVSKGTTGLIRWVRRTSVLITLPLIPIVLVLIVAPDTVMSLVYDGKFDRLGLGLVLALSAIAQLLAFVRFPMETAVLASGAPRPLFLISILPVIMLFTVSIAAIAAFGIVGVPLASILTSVVSLLATYVVYRRQVVQLGTPRGPRG